MWYYICREMLRILFRFTGGVKAINEENIPRGVGVIVAPNHVSFADPPTVAIGVSRHVHFMAKKELFDAPILGPILYNAGSFPVRRGTADRKAIKRAIELLDGGKVVGIFPEGTRGVNGKLLEPELGIGLIALKSRAPVVPSAIIGSDKTLPPHAKRLHFQPIKIVFGTPMTFPDLYESTDSRAAMEEIGRRIMAAIAELLSQNAS